MKLYTTALALFFLVAGVRADTISIGTAGPFAVLGHAGVTNTGPSLIFGSVSGSTVTPAVTGFTFSTSPGPGLVFPPGVGFTTGVSTPFTDAGTAYTFAQATPGAFNLTGSVLGSGGTVTSLLAGVYSFSSSASLAGILSLDAGGTDNASWIFQIGSSLTTASASGIQIVNAGAAGPYTGSITWAVGSAATLGTTTKFLGTIISQAGSTLNTGATVGCGRVISLNGSVTLDSNVIDTPADCSVTGGMVGPPASIPSAVPEPAAFAMVSMGLLAALVLKARR